MSGYNYQEPGQENEEIKTRKLEQGIQSVGSLRGNSSHNHNPFIALKRQSADEFQGDVIGMSLVYSGNFLMRAEVDTYDVTRILMEFINGISMAFRARRIFPDTRSDHHIFRRWAKWNESDIP